MPIEIRELVIRVTVNQPIPAGGAEANPVTGQTGGAADSEAVIAQCVEEALRIIGERQER